MQNICQFVLRCPSGPGVFYRERRFMSKVYKTYRQLVRILRKRNLQVKDGSKAIRILEKENYYNVINGYKDLFLKNRATATTEEEYLDNTLLDEIYALYTFDREIRIIHLKYLFDSAIKKLSRQLKVISIQKVLNTMGYTSDWKNVLQLTK